MEEAMSAADSLFLAPRNNICILTIIGFQTKLNPDIIKHGVGEILQKHPRFTSVVVRFKHALRCYNIVVKDAKKGGKMFWKQEEYDLENHIIVPNIDLDMDSPDRFVEDYISELTCSTMDLSKPLWELHIINLKTMQADSILVLKVHHSLGDGASLISLLLASTRKTSDPTALPTFPQRTKAQNKQPQSEGFKTLIFKVWFAFTLILNTVVDMLLFLSMLVFLKDTKTPLKGGRRLEGNPKRLILRTISLDDMKSVKNVMNVTINDVALGMIQAGLTRYLHRKYMEKEVSNKEIKKRTKQIRLRAAIIFNVRPTDETKAIADIMERLSKEMQNNIVGYVILPFNTTLQDDPLDYIRQVKVAMDRKKHSLEALCTMSSNAASLKLFGAKMAGFLIHRIFSNTTFSISNVVGPTEEISFYGHPIAYIAPTITGGSQAFTIFLQGYANKMTIVLGADQSVISDPHKLCNDFVESFELIKTAALEK